MNILLLQQFTGRKEKPVFPLGLAYIAQSLKKHCVKVLDCNLCARDHQKIIVRHMDEFKPDLIGVSLRNIDTSLAYDTFSYLKHFYADIKAIRGRNDKAIIVAGGAGFSLFPYEIMDKADGIDFGIAGEGEETFPELVEHIDYPARVKGVYLREKNGTITFTGKRPAVDFDAVPPVPWNLFDIEAYKKQKYQFGIQTKRGCGLECLYCVYPYLTGNAVRLRSGHKVVDEIESLTAHGVNEVFFCDSVFNMPLEHAETICREIIARDVRIKWTAFFTEKFITKEFVDLCVRAGCTCFQFSPDGIAGHVLKKLNKIQTREEMDRAYGAFAPKTDIRVKIYLFLNSPGQNIRYVQSLIGFIIQTVFKKRRFSCRLHTMRIYPGTRLYGVSVSGGVIKKDRNLVDPVFYDPFPLNLISMPLNITGWITMKFIRLFRLNRCF